MLNLEEVNPLAVSVNSKLLRELAGLTQSELAKAAGICVASVGRAETFTHIYSQLSANSVAWVCYLKISDGDVEQFTRLIMKPLYLPNEWAGDNAGPHELSNLDIFGMNLKKIRFRFGLSLGQLGALTGYHFSYASAIENGRQPMTEAFMSALDKVFTALAIDEPNLMSWYDAAKRAPIIASDPPKYSSPKSMILVL